MEKTIKSLISKSLSNDEIMGIINNKANLISYKNIHKYRSLDELLGNNNACVILYETKPNYGHWCCIFKLNDEMVEFFDPYSIFPDKQIELINDEYREKSNQNYPYLTKLMVESPYILSYNHYPFQKYAKGINTCGRWVALRLLFRFMDLESFIDLFSGRKKYSKDFYVTLLTNYA